MYDFHIGKFEKEIEKLNQNGCDIKIIKKEVRGNPDMNSYKRAATISLVMPSSNYSMYEKMMNNKYKKQSYDKQTDILRDNYFIPPIVYQREMIDSLIDHIREERDEKPDRYDFAPYGYATVEIDTTGGYGRFEELRPEKDALDKAIRIGFESVRIYENKNAHLNGMMPCNIVYFKEKAKELGYEDSVRKTVVRDLMFLDLEDQKPVKERAKKPKLK